MELLFEISGGDVVTKMRTLAGTIAAATVVVLTLSATAIAAEPRPWLCRDKPAFSDSHPMRYQVSSKGGAWQIFFMQLASFSGGESRGSHDGFTIVDSRELSRTPQTGTLPAGQFYAVALRNRGGVWICTYGEESPRQPGTISNLCYGADSGSDCLVTLSVKPQ